MPDFQALLDAVKAAVQAQFDAAVNSAHDAGFAEGVASVVSPPPVDVQAQIDAAVVAKVAEIKAMLLAGLNDEQAAEDAFKAIVSGL